MNDKGYEKICEVSQVKGFKLVAWHKFILCVMQLNNKWVAFEDRCPHRGGPLSEGDFAEQSVICCWHKKKFFLKKNPDEIKPQDCDGSITCFDLIEQSGWLWIKTYLPNGHV